MKSLLVKKKVKQFALEYAAAHRSHKFTRISKRTLETWEARFRAMISSEIMSLPSKGKTI